MATKKVIVSGGTYGRRPTAIDTETGAVLWQGTHIIDEGCLFVETPLGNLCIIDDERRSLLVSKDGEILKETYTASGGLLALVQAKVIELYPDAQFGVFGPTQQPWSLYSRMRQPRGLVRDSNVYYVGENRWMITKPEVYFGSDESNVSYPNPTGYQHPGAIIYTYVPETDTYSDVVWVDNDLAYGQNAWLLRADGTYAYFYEDSGIVRISLADGTSARKSMAIGGTGFGMIADNKCAFTPVYTTDPAPILFMSNSQNGYLIQDIAAVFDLEASNPAYCYEDQAAFDAAHLTTIDTSALDPNLVSSQGWNDTINFWGNAQWNQFDGYRNYAVGDPDGTSLLMCANWDPGTGPVWQVLRMSWASTTITITPEDATPFPRIQWVTTGYGSLEYDSIPYAPILSADTLSWLCVTDGGLFRVERSTGTITPLYQTGDDDEDWTAQFKSYDWPTYTVSAAVTKSPDNTLNVMMYDQATGALLREQEVTGTETITCFTPNTKFLVCRSPNGTSNFQIAAHMTPVATA